jgi:hypothetical protein
LPTKSSNAGVIAGSIVGCVVFLAAILFFAIKRNTIHKAKRRLLSPNGTKTTLAVQPPGKQDTSAAELDSKSVKELSTTELLGEKNKAIVELDSENIIELSATERSTIKGRVELE